MGALSNVIFGKLLGAGLGVGTAYLQKAIQGSKAEDERANEDAEAKRKLDIIKLYKAGGGEMTETGKAAEIEIFQNLIDSAPQHLRDQTDQFIDPRIQAMDEAGAFGPDPVPGAQDPSIDPGGELQGTVQKSAPQGFFKAAADKLVPVDPVDQARIDLLEEQKIATSALAEQRGQSALTEVNKRKLANQKAAREARDAERKSELKPINDAISSIKDQIALATNKRKNAKDKAGIAAADADLSLLAQSLQNAATHTIRPEDYKETWEILFKQYKVLYGDDQAAWDAFVLTPMGQYVKALKQQAGPAPKPAFKKRVEPFPKSRGATHRAR